MSCKSPRTRSLWLANNDGFESALPANMKDLNPTLAANMVCPQLFSTGLDSKYCKGIDGPPVSTNLFSRLEEEGWGQGEVQRLDGLQVEDQLEGDGLLHSVIMDQEGTSMRLVTP